MAYVTIFMYIKNVQITQHRTTHIEAYTMNFCSVVLR